MTGRSVAQAATLVLAVATGASVGGASASSLSLASQAYTALRTCTVGATPSSTTAVANSTVQQATPSSNSGTTTTVEVASANGANRRVHLRFDLSGCSPTIPSSASVRAATLRLYISATANGCRTIDIFRVATSWTETAITWTNQPFGATINSPTSASRTDSFDVGSSGGCENHAVGYATGANVTADVAAFVAGSSNLGWMLRDDSEGSGAARTTTFSAKELSVLAQAPQLVVTYVSAP